jgi:DNA-directed RNA polymerase alpha subunit
VSQAELSIQPLDRGLTRCIGTPLRRIALRT